MARYKVEYEIEATGIVPAGMGRGAVRQERALIASVIPGTTNYYYVPNDAVVTEVKPKHPDGWYQCVKTGALFTVNGETASRLFRYKSGNGTSNGATFPVSEKWFKEHTFLGSA